MTTYERSDGPDRLKNKYACRIYHEGTRTFESYKSPSGRYMLSDIDCCCDPCNHVKSNYEHTLCADGTDEDSEASSESGCYCCSCSPHMIMATWEGDNPADPCSTNSFVEPMFVYTDNHDKDHDNHWSSQYLGTLVGRNISAYISNYEIGESGNFVSDDGSGCRWTLFVGGTGATEPATSVTSLIDHTETTCLSVPTNVSISGVIPTHGGSGGTINFHNYFGKKVPFQKRTDDSGIFWPIDPIHHISGGIIEDPGTLAKTAAMETFSPPQTGLSITLPSGRISPPFFFPGFDAPNTTPTGGGWVNGCNHTGVVYPTGVSGIPRKSLCDEVPRFLCVETIGAGSNYGQEIREFEFDTGYYPTHRMEFHPSYTGIEYFTTGTVLCRWAYTPLNYEHSGTEPPITNPTQAWHNPARDKYKKYVFLYETFVDAIAEFSGNMDVVANSGSPKYALIPAMNLDPLPIFNSEIEMRGAASESRYFYFGSPHGAQNTVGSAYIAHEAIHNFYDFPTNTLKTQNEQFYWTSGTHTKTPWLGGVDYGAGKVQAGDGTSCPCDMRADTSYFVSARNQTRMSIKPGKCSCWGYYCSDSCRCVPEELCYISIEYEANGTQIINKGNLIWNTGNLAWEAGESGLNLPLKRSSNGFKTGDSKETYTPACVVPTFADESGYYVDKGYSLSQATDRETTVHCSYNDMQFEFSDIKRNADGDVESGVAVYMFPNYLTANCDFKMGCNEASPCETGCNSHPDTINLSLYAYGVPDEDECEDESEEGDGDGCGDTFGPIDIQLHYNQRLTILGTTPPEVEVACWYEGFTTCDDHQLQIKWVGGPIDNAGLTIIPSGAGFGGPGAPDYSYFATTDSPGWMTPLSATQTCEPYYVSGTWRDGGAPISIDWGCPEGTFYRFNMVITEV